MIHKSSEWNQPRCSSTDVRTVKMWQYTHGILFICKEILNLQKKWMSLESIMLTKVVQIQRDNYHMFTVL